MSSTATHDQNQLSRDAPFCANKNKAQRVPRAPLNQNQLSRGAPFCAKKKNDLWIEQPSYTRHQHETWHRLYSRILPRWDHYANRHFLAGVQSLALPPDRIPLLSDVNRFLKPRTGFEARAVAGY